MKHGVDQEHEQHEQHGQPQDQHTEGLRAPLERRSGRPHGQRVGDLRERSVLSSAYYHDSSATADRRSSHQHDVCRGSHVCAGFDLCGVLLYRVRLARHQRLIDEEITSLHHAPVGRHEVARRQQHDVARDQLRDRYLARLPATHYRCAHRDCAAQAFDRPSRTVLLHEVQKHAEQDD